MSLPSPKLVELARRIVEQQAGEASGPAASSAAVDAACQRLAGHLVDLLGSGGVFALLRRALHLAQRQYPLLADVTVSGESTVCFSKLTDTLAAGSDEEAMAAATAILTHVMGLLVMLLGEELAMKPVRKLWPHATSAGEAEV